MKMSEELTTFDKQLYNLIVDLTFPSGIAVSKKVVSSILNCSERRIRARMSVLRRYYNKRNENGERVLFHFIGWTSDGFVASRDIDHAFQLKRETTNRMYAQVRDMQKKIDEIWENE